MNWRLLSANEDGDYLSLLRAVLKNWYSKPREGWHVTDVVMCPRPYAFETPSKTKKPKQTNEVARDTKLRKEFYKSAMSQFNLLKMIGITQMENELLKE